MEDVRNLTDEFKGKSNERVFDVLETRRTPLEIAIGKKKYNRRGAMCTDKYLKIEHHPTIEDFLSTQKNRELVAIENNTKRARPLNTKQFNSNTTLIFGSENNGISQDLLEIAHDVRFIESFGSTRSVNVGVAAGIAMYEYARQIIL